MSMLVAYEAMDIKNENVHCFFKPQHKDHFKLRRVAQAWLRVAVPRRRYARRCA
jgi:hypothetical protein